VDGVRFLGATLWTDFLLFGEEMRAAAEEVCRDTVTDFRAIRTARSGANLERGIDWTTATLPASAVQRRHQKTREWLAAELDKPFAGSTVVVTHHLPSKRSVAERFADDLTSAAYASNLDGLMGKSALWIHGHAHDSFDYRIATTRVVCNPRGYCHRSGTPCENPAFVPDLVIEL